MTKLTLDTKFKQKLAMLFWEHPMRYFSLREISRRLRVGDRKIKSVLSYFTKKGILQTFDKKNQRYFGLNKLSEHLSDLDSLFSTGKKKKKSRNKDLIEKELLKTGTYKFVALYGVFSGHPKAEADLLLVGKARSKKLEKCVKFLEGLVQNEINYVIMDAKEFTQRLYSFDWFIKEILERQSVVLVDTLTKKSANFAPKKIIKSFSNVKTR